VAHRQAARLTKLRRERSQAAVDRTLLALKKAAGTYTKAGHSSGSPNGHLSHENLMPHIYHAVKAYATLGEICDAMRTVFGTYEETAVT